MMTNVITIGWIRRDEHYSMHPLCRTERVIEVLRGFSTKLVSRLSAADDDVVTLLSRCQYSIH